MIRRLSAPFLAFAALTLPVVAGAPGCQCRYSADPSANVEIDGSLDFGPVPDGFAGTATVLVHGTSIAPAISVDAEGMDATWIRGTVGSAARLVASCDPSLNDGDSGSIELDFGGAEPFAVDWSCSAGERPARLPDPLLEPIDLQAFASVPGSELGDAAIAASDGARFVLNPPTGDVFVSDPVAGRLWRQGFGYKVPGWGAWLPQDMELYENWDPYPPCIAEGMWNRQDGSCTGAERSGDGDIPENWIYVHSGFVGDDDYDLTGVRAGVALEDQQLIAVVGDRDDEGFVAVVDAGLAVELGDESPYSYLQLVRDADSEQTLPAGLEITASESGAWLVEPNTGVVWQLQEVDELSPIVVRADFEIGPVSATANIDDALVLRRDDGSWAKLDAAGLAELAVPVTAWSGLVDLAPTFVAGDRQAVWAWYADPGVLAWWDTGSGLAGLVAVPSSVQTVHHLAADRIFGGSAETSSMAWIVAEDADGAIALLGAQAEEAVLERGGVALPALPMAMAIDGAPHDLYLAYPAGADGCDGDLAALCSDGEHPAAIASYYAPYGLVPPTSTGHPLNMFINPILETPKDHQVNSDFSKGEARCDDAPADFDERLYDGCCALSWAVRERVAPSMDYVAEAWLTIGSDTESTDDDVAVTIGLNPTWLRQARDCYGELLTAPQGYEALEILDYYGDMGMGYTHWTHTSMADQDATEPMDWFMGLLYESGVDFSFPMASQAEYQMLHDGMYAASRYDDLPDFDDMGTDVVMTTLEVPLQGISGNHFDGPVMLSDEGWPDDDPSWNRAGRDGPLALGDDPFQAYYFASAGTDPAVGLDGFRKKELFPLDIRTRAAAFEMGEDPQDWFLGGDSGVLYLPGHSWALNTQGDLHEAGLFRESQVWGTETEERDWEQVIRYLRRIIASSQPDDVKVWYLHIFDFTNTGGIIEDNSGVTPQVDINVDALEAINALLVHPGHARWAQPDAVVDEWLATSGDGGSR